MVKHMKRLLSAYSRHFFAEVLGRSLRGSLLVGGSILLLSKTGLWLYLASSLSAHDLQRSASWDVGNADAEVVVVGIDDLGYEEYFKGRSPLDRLALRDLLAAIDASTPPQATLVLDLDLSPGLDEDPGLLSALWKNAAPHRWILASAGLQVPDPLSHQQKWRDSVCGAGVRLGFPYLPSEFGYASSTHQFRGGMTDVFRDATPGCQYWREIVGSSEVSEGNLQLKRWAAPMDGPTLRSGVMLPFQGNLAEIKSALSQLAPQVVVVGGVWGPSDVFVTPFGERFGVQLHAASIQGQRLGHRLAPYWVQVLVSWLIVTFLALLFGKLYQSLMRIVAPWKERAPGHRFLVARVWPLAMTVATIFSVLLASELFAFIHARTGFLIPTAAVAFVVLTTMVFTWNWGLNNLQLHESVRQAWYTTFVMPIKEDWQGLCTSWHEMRGTKSSALTGIVRMSRSRAALEVALCAVSLAVQTILPLSALVLTLTRPL